MLHFVMFLCILMKKINQKARLLIKNEIFCKYSLEVT